MTAASFDSYAVLDRYGVAYSGDQSVPDHSAVDYASHYTLGRLVQEGGKITRLRIFKEAGRYDISYCHGTLPNGQVVSIQPMHIFVPIRQFKGELIAWARSEGVYAKGCGLLDESNWSVLG